MALVSRCNEDSTDCTVIAQWQLMFTARKILILHPRVNSCRGNDHSAPGLDWHDFQLSEELLHRRLVPCSNRFPGMWST